MTRILSSISKNKPVSVGKPEKVKETYCLADVFFHNPFLEYQNRKICQSSTNPPVPDGLRPARLFPADVELCRSKSASPSEAHLSEASGTPLRKTPRR